MKARFMIDEPELVNCTLKVTMPLRDWITLRDNLRTTGVEYSFRAKITELITKVKKVYYAEEELGES